jgi:hypothetical protein
MLDGQAEHGERELDCSILLLLAAAQQQQQQQQQRMVYLARTGAAPACKPMELFHT